MKTLEFKNDSEELVIEKFKDGSVELSIEYETPIWDSSDAPAFVSSTYALSKEQVASLIEFLTKSLEGK